MGIREQGMGKNLALVATGLIMLGFRYESCDNFWFSVG
jgi:hypothetical protein